MLGEWARAIRRNFTDSTSAVPHALPRAVKKAQQVGVKVKELQQELQETEIEAVAADGGVTVVISGAQVPISVDVTAELLAKGSDAVSEAVSLAAKEAHTNSMEYAKQRMSELYSEIGLPMPPQEGQPGM